MTNEKTFLRRWVKDRYKFMANVVDMRNACAFMPTAELIIDRRLRLRKVYEWEVWEKRMSWKFRARIGSIKRIKLGYKIIFIMGNK